QVSPVARHNVGNVAHQGSQAALALAYGLEREAFPVNVVAGDYATGDLAFGIADGRSADTDPAQVAVTPLVEIILSRHHLAMQCPCQRPLSRLHTTSVGMIGNPFGIVLTIWRVDNGVSQDGLHLRVPQDDAAG